MRHRGARVSLLVFSASVALGGAGCREGVLDVVNHAPLVQSVVATPQMIFSGQQATLRVEATDEDGDGIRYFWAAEAGSFDLVVGESVQWTAPAFGGDYWIEVSASDRIASTSAALRIRVEPSQP